MHVLPDNDTEIEGHRDDVGSEEHSSNDAENVYAVVFYRTVARHRRMSLIVILLKLLRGCRRFVWFYICFSNTFQLVRLAAGRTEASRTGVMIHSKARSATKHLACCGAYCLDISIALP